MRLTVFGATGQTGKLFVRRALAEGHVVTAVVRRPQAVTEDHPGLTVVKGDVFEPLKIERDTDAVVFLAGPTGPGPHLVYSRGVPNVLQAMADAGVGHLVAVSTATEYCTNDSPLQHAVKFLLQRTFLRQPFQESTRLTALLSRSPEDWTLVRPPRLLDRPARGYRTAMGDGVRNGFSIGREDLADAVLRVLPDPATHRRVVDVAY